MYGTATLEDALEIYQNNLKQLAEVETPIHIFLDLRAMTRYTTSVREMKDLLRPNESPNLWWMVIVINRNPVLKFIVSLMTQILSKQVRFKLFDSLEEAFAFLGNIDPSLDLQSLEAEFQPQL